ncbi:hypothetical protein K1719_015339 [Acacia pycnantha]|nr:hypothetical protein K1719_015339 [Acacia pycnantha]
MVKLKIALLGVTNDIGENGLLLGMASNKFPPWLILSVGALFSFLGYGGLRFSVTCTLLSLSYWLVCSPFSFFVSEALNLGIPLSGN